MKTLERIRLNAEKFPDRIAYRIRDLSLSYGTLWDSASGLACTLCGEPNDKIVLLGEKEPEMLIGMLACLIAGKAYVPVSASSPAERVLRQIGPCRVLSAGSASETSSKDRIRDLISASGASARKQTLPDSLRKIPDTAAAYILFTSGSTGQPKGVPISRENLDSFTDWICAMDELRFPAPVRVMNQASFCFDLSVADLYYSLCGGHTLIGLPPEATRDPCALQALLENSDPTVAVCTPTYLKLCLLDRSFCRDRLPSLRAIWSCGEILENGTARKLLDRFPDLCLINAYGPTEATSAVCAVPITREMLSLPGSLPVGRFSMAACEIDVSSGEIRIRGKSVFQGYFNQENPGICIENGQRCFPTGDFGRSDGDLLYFEGRKDRQVKWKGYRIELDEIERNLMDLPSVTACAVTAVRNEEGSVRFLRAFVCTEAPCPETELAEALQKKLPSYMIPKVIRRVDALPVTENGKIDRKKLEKL